MSGYYVDTRYHPLPIYILHFGSFSLHTARSHDQARAGASCAKFLTNFHKFQSRPSEELKMLGLAQACCSCWLVTDWRSWLILLKIKLFLSFQVDNSIKTRWTNLNKLQIFCRKQDKTVGRGCYCCWLFASNYKILYILNCAEVEDNKNVESSWPKQQVWRVQNWKSRWCYGTEAYRLFSVCGKVSHIKDGKVYVEKFLLHVRQEKNL